MKYKIKNKKPSNISIFIGEKLYGFAPFEEKIVEVDEDLKISYGDVEVKKVSRGGGKK